MKTLSVLNFRMHFFNLIKWVKGLFHKISREKLIERKLGIYNNIEGYWMANDFNETSQKNFQTSLKKIIPSSLSSKSLCIFTS